MSEQIQTFTNGGFVVHKIYISGSKCKFSAWYDADGKLENAARYDAHNREFEATEAQRKELNRLGRMYRFEAHKR
jgi:hypothetical protein